MSSRTTLYHRALICRVRNAGVIMAFRCVHCQKSDSDCVKSHDSTNCLSCLQRGRKCEMAPYSESDFKKIDAERARLDAEEEAADATVETGHTMAATGHAMAEAALRKKRRVRQLKRYLAQREARMIEKGFSNVEEMEKWEEEEERQKSAPGPSSSTSVTPGPEFNSFEADLAEMASLSPSFWESLASGETPQ